MPLKSKCHPTTDWKILFFWYLVLYESGILIQLSDSGRWAVNHQRCPETRALQNEVHSPTSTRAECVQPIRPVMHAHKCWLSWHADLKDCRAPCSAWKCASQLVEDKLGLDSVASLERCLTSSHWAEKKIKNPDQVGLTSPHPVSTSAVLHHCPSVRWAISSATPPSITPHDQTAQRRPRWH